MMRNNSRNIARGFTLIEILLVVAILAIIGTIATFGFTNARKVKDLEHDTRAVAAYLRDAQQRSITGADGAEWRVEFHKVSGQDYYELVSSGSSVAAHVVLKPSVELYDFYINSNQSVGCAGVSSCPSVPARFKPLSGELIVFGPGLDPPYAVELRTLGGLCPAECRTITINGNGTIEY
jgi:prepilin-type N-terminal cleavage/methylation domain-containing protein